MNVLHFHKTTELYNKIKDFLGVLNSGFSGNQESIEALSKSISQQKTTLSSAESTANTQELAAAGVMSVDPKKLKSVFGQASPSSRATVKIKGSGYLVGIDSYYVYSIKIDGKTVISTPSGDASSGNFSFFGDKKRLYNYSSSTVSDFFLFSDGSMDTSSSKENIKLYYRPLKFNSSVEISLGSAYNVVYYQESEG